MARVKKRSHSWVAPVVCTACFILIIILIGHLLFVLEVISPYDKNGINKIHVTCDGKKGMISTQRYYGFDDFSVDSFKSFSDLPLTSQLSCRRSTASFERRSDLLDRIFVRMFCDGKIIGNSDVASSLDLGCNGILTIEVTRT